jgi:hypothetical protein
MGRKQGVASSRVAGNDRGTLTLKAAKRKNDI